MKTTTRTDGTIQFDTRVSIRIGDRVYSPSCCFYGVLLGGDTDTAILREDDDRVSAWPWSDLVPASAYHYTDADQTGCIDPLEGLPGALMEVQRAADTANVKEAQVALREAVIDGLAKVWPDHAETIKNNAAS